MFKRNIIKLLSTILAMTIVFCSAPLSGFVGLKFPELKLPDWNLFDFSVKVEAATSGIYTYTVADGKAKITDCDTSASGSITIPSTLGGYPVTSIGDYAFYNCTSLTSVTIPDNVISIGDYAFYKSTSLTSITIPDSVTSIDYCAFFECTSLARVYYTGDIESWCNISFDDGSANPMYYAKNFYINKTLVKEIVIPDTVTEIKDYAFFNFEGITSVIIPDSVTSVGESAFSRCTNLTSVIIPDSVTSIGYYAFLGCTSLTSVTIPDSVTSIEHQAFDSCTSLTSIVIPDSVTRIKHRTFNNCTSLTSIVIPDSVTSIGIDAFNNTAYFNDASNWENNVLYIDNRLIKANDSLSGTYVIKSGTKTIADGAFYGCKYLTLVTVTDIDSVTSIGESAFRDCTSLTSVTIPDGVTNIGYRAFSGCKSLTSVTIPDSVTKIGGDAFRDCTSLTSVTIPDGVTSIGATFWGCTALTSVTIPDSVTNIGADAFRDCTELKELTIPASAEIYNSEYTFYNCTNIEKVTLTKGTGTMQNYGTSTSYYVADTHYRYTPWYISRNKIKEIIIEDGVTNVGSYAFCDCENVTSIVIPKSVIHIGNYAFEGCKSLTTVTIPERVTSIGNGAFYKCTNLTSVTIPDSVTNIGYDAFNSCKNLKDIYYGGTEAQWKKISIGSYNSSLTNANIHFSECIHEYELEAKKEPTCTKTGYTTYTCVVCDDTYTNTIPATGHNYKSSITAPTCAEQGYTTYTCVVCGDSYKDNFVPALGMVSGVSVDNISLTYKDVSKIVPNIKTDEGVDFNVEYSSSDPAVVSIDKDGNITTIGTGEAEITVTVTDEYGNVVEDTCKVTVSYAWWQWLIIIFLFGWIWY